MPPAAGLVPFMLNKLRGSERDGVVPWEPLQGCARALGTGTAGLEDPAGGCHHPREGPGLGWEGKNRGKREKEKGKEGAKWPESQEGSLSSASSCSIPSKPAAPPGPEPLGDEAGAPHSLLTAASPPPVLWLLQSLPVTRSRYALIWSQKINKKKEKEKNISYHFAFAPCGTLGCGDAGWGCAKSTARPRGLWGGAEHPRTHLGGPRGWKWGHLVQGDGIGRVGDLWSHPGTAHLRPVPRHRWPRAR